jgi:flavodoxin-like protein
MHALVVYESLWGNTAAVARAIADGLGDEAEAMTPDQVSNAMVEGADLIVAGAPVFGFSLPTEKLRDAISRDEADAPTPPDLSHPSLRSWLDSIPPGHARAAAFETRIWWSPRGATGDIEKKFASAGYQPIAKAQKFVVRGKYGPLRDGELERARAWGASLRRALEG